MMALSYSSCDRVTVSQHAQSTETEAAKWNPPLIISLFTPVLFLLSHQNVFCVSRAFSLLIGGQVSPVTSSIETKPIQNKLIRATVVMVAM